MTKELPGLGSGALRPFETFTVIALHSDVDTTQQFVVTVVSKRGSFSSAKREFIEQAIRAALSLSSPIEQCEGCDAADGRKTVKMCADCIRKVSLEARRLEREKATSQASSEIRETLADVVQFFDSNYESSEEWCGGPRREVFRWITGKAACAASLAPKEQAGND